MASCCKEREIILLFFQVANPKIGKNEPLGIVFAGQFAGAAILICLCQMGQNGSLNAVARQRSSNDYNVEVGFMAVTPLITQMKRK